MDRGVSNGGGQNSLGYLFRSGNAPAPTNQIVNSAPPSKLAISPQPVDIAKQIPAGINSTSSSNYLVDSTPGGGSSLGYLFGGDSN
ncbi:hypothetical protein K2173_002431 [Erythroxylum novogranatense]|uniref:Uncharacterized protein n=1 Tax=Erythroxylum novogranatense TaxID=1862640 RepID=A0AAV8TBQ6_9ROSI|nr:hypothetical protein K2173_002431 [Erythroxylum novogranatense]